MMKIFLMVLLMLMMVLENKMVSFYYNLCYLFSFFLFFMYMFKESGWVNVGSYLGLNYFSFFLLLLSFWIFGLMFMSLSALGSMNKLKILIFFSLMLTLLIFFLTMNLIFFYLMFEVSLIPTFFLIVYWGGSPERLSASYYFLMYMLLISFPLLIYIFKIYMYSYSFSFSILILMAKEFFFSFWGYVIIYFSFFIKLPIYLFHSWLPKAHVEAPVYGSMILAGVLLKMGGYGLVRFLEIFIKYSIYYNYMVLGASIVGGMLTSMICFTQVDMKSLVAYSSVVHMNMMLSSLMTMYKMGFFSAYIIMISHGLCSSGMFYMVNFYYSRSMSRSLLLNKGMLSMVPSMSIWWFLLCVINFSYPFSFNFISEIFMLGSLFNWSQYLIFYLMLVCFFSSGYSLYLFSYIQHGKGYLESVIKEATNQEYMVVFIHVFPIFLMLLNLLMFM